MDLLSRHPFKGIWTTFAVLTTALRFPLWMLYYLPRSLRQNPKWSFRQALKMNLVKTFLYHCTIIRIKVPTPLEAGKEGRQFAVLEPADSKYYTGAVDKDPEVRPGKLGGTWFPEFLENGVKPGVVVLHFHGGAFVIGDGRKEDAGFCAKTLLANTKASHVFCPQYRLASNPGGRFPAHLQDAITAYHHLVLERGIDPSNIVVSGDSAGGNIVLALLRYLADNGEQIGLDAPGCAWLWSPWANPVESYFDPEAMVKSPKERTDYLSGSFGTWGARSVAPAPTSGLSIAHPYLSHIDNPFATKTPVWIQTGGSEVLFHEDVKLYEQMKSVESNKVELHIEEECPHDIILTGALIGFEVEAGRSAKKAGEFWAGL